MPHYVTVICPICGGHDLVVSVIHDKGCWRTANGDGWPESFDVEWVHELHPEPTDRQCELVDSAAIQAYYDAQED